MGFMSMGMLGVLALIIITSVIKILSEWERGVILRFGRCIGVRGPGLIFLIPGVERMVRIDTRTITMDIQPQDVISKDNVTLKVNAIVYFRVMDPELAITQVEDFFFATSKLAQTTLRSVVGQFELDSLLGNREQINQSVQSILDKATEPWGIKISVVEVKDIDLPKEMQRAMAKEAEAERERRAKVISAEGEFQRSEMLMQASNKLAESPSALQLAYLQALKEVSNEGKTTIVMPIPIDLVKPFLSNENAR